RFFEVVDREDRELRPELAHRLRADATDPQQFEERGRYCRLLLLEFGEGACRCDGLDLLRDRRTYSPDTLQLVDGHPSDRRVEPAYLGGRTLVCTDLVDIS